MKDKTTKIKKILVCAIMLSVILCFTACGKASAGAVPQKFSVSTSISKAPGVYVLLDPAITKRSFQTNGYYSDRGYNLLGEIDSINISVVGTISRAACPVDTDFFRLSIKAPDETSKIIVHDANYTEYQSSKLSDDGYFNLDIIWLNNFDYYGRLCGTEKINCFYIAFCNEYDTWDWTPIEEYFVYITYDLTFTD